jgi:hypothetical protein
MRLDILQRTFAKIQPMSSYLSCSLIPRLLRAGLASLDVSAVAPKEWWREISLAGVALTHAMTSKIWFFSPKLSAILEIAAAGLSDETHFDPA